MRRTGRKGWISVGGTGTALRGLRKGWVRDGGAQGVELGGGVDRDPQGLCRWPWGEALGPHPRLCPCSWGRSAARRTFHSPDPGPGQ